MALQHREWLAGTILSFLPSCSLNHPPENNQPTKSNTFMLEQIVEHLQLEEEGTYTLMADKERLNALETFLKGSSGQAVAPKDVLDHVVAICSDSSFPQLIGQGYLLDDCGLVLTVEHVRGLLSRETYIITPRGERFPVLKTEASDYFHDWAVLFALTNKPQKSHYLPFANRDATLPEKEVRYVVYTGDKSKSRFDKKGYVAQVGINHETLDSCPLRRTFEGKSWGQEDKEEGERASRMAESIYARVTVRQGDSGSLVLSDGKCLGMVWGLLEKEEQANTSSFAIKEGNGLITKGWIIEEGLRAYCAEARKILENLSPKEK